MRARPIPFALAIASVLASATAGADVLAIEREVASTRESIERMKAQPRVLEAEISLATVRIQLSTQPPPAPPALGSLPRIAHAGREGIDAAGAFVVGSAVIAAAAGPALSILLLVALWSWRIARALQARSRARQAAEALNSDVGAPRP